MECFYAALKSRSSTLVPARKASSETTIVQSLILRKFLSFILSLQAGPVEERPFMAASSETRIAPLGAEGGSKIGCQKNQGAISRAPSIPQSDFLLLTS
jgi:hypothetical protein